ncbi:MAG: flagellar type III secretion system pore protein FliP [Deltaproteobacteria bacterium]|nr:flagellar type III secretion system pore protein FliP [Deltaproteobacteria bacterium]
MANISNILLTVYSATEKINIDFSSGFRPGLFLFLLVVLAFIPFIVMMLTSFVKYSVVLTILKNAIGLQQIPPASVITGLSIILTTYTMQPVAQKMYDSARESFERDNAQLKLDNVPDIIKAFEAAKPPLIEYLRTHTGSREFQLFTEAAESRIEKDSILVFAPAFVITQLKEAFILGFRLFIPFLIIDLLVANLLIALGLNMLTPVTISLPLKLLIFILADGWYLITKNLILHN